ncbi:uncharacterized protein LOC131656380 [Vicia villosa]|uniref:uncharacterized protein LOC131656380 n=1 Tax=Vicia villosa TaxID=3911 RepID=UPI00273C5173|nr:uncharacterized protein LOC131656380 [Vicia villosa]
MKLSTPTTSCSNVSPSTSSNTPMCSSKRTSTGCLTAIMHKILCSGNLPKDSSNQITEFDSTNSVLSAAEENYMAAAAAVTPPPPLVARLMGLESMIPYALKPGSLSRSKSLNSMDYLGESDGKVLSLNHKRVNSTLSFREPPTFRLSENDNFFVLSFENEGENAKALKSNGRKKQTGCSESKQKVAATERNELKEKKNKKENVYDERNLIEKEKTSKRVSNKLQEITNTSRQFKALSEKKSFDSEAVELLKPRNYNEAVVGEKLQKRKRIRKKRTNCCAEKKIETECIKSEDTSPVSVLEFDRKSCAAGVDSVAVGLNSRRKLTPELEKGKPVIMRSDDNLMIDEKKDKEIEKNKCEESEKKVKKMKEYVDIWGEACKLVEDELGGSKNQVDAWMKEQCADFESEIFDQMLNEVVSELVG